MKKSTLGWTRALYIILAVIYIIAGFYAILNPLVVDAMIPIFVGTLLLIYGGIVVISYFMSTRNKSIWSLVMGIAMIVLGLLCFGSQLFRLTYLIAYIVGISLIVMGVIKSVNSFTYKSTGMTYWWSVLLLGILDILVGILIFMNPLTIALYLGAGLIANGVSDFVIAFTAA